MRRKLSISIEWVGLAMYVVTTCERWCASLNCHFLFHWDRLTSVEAPSISIQAFIVCPAVIYRSYRTLNPRVIMACVGPSSILYPNWNGKMIQLPLKLSCANLQIMLRCGLQKHLQELQATSLRADRVLAKYFYFLKDCYVFLLLGQHLTLSSWEVQESTDMSLSKNQIIIHQISKFLRKITTIIRMHVSWLTSWISISVDLDLVPFEYQMQSRELGCHFHSDPISRGCVDSGKDLAGLSHSKCQGNVCWMFCKARNN